VDPVVEETGSCLVEEPIGDIGHVVLVVGKAGLRSYSEARAVARASEKKKARRVRKERQSPPGRPYRKISRLHERKAALAGGRRGESVQQQGRVLSSGRKRRSSLEKLQTARSDGRQNKKARAAVRHREAEESGSSSP